MVVATRVAKECFDLCLIPSPASPIVCCSLNGFWLVYWTACLEHLLHIIHCFHNNTWNTLLCIIIISHVRIITRILDYIHVSKSSFIWPFQYLHVVVVTVWKLFSLIMNAVTFLLFTSILWGCFSYLKYLWLYFCLAHFTCGVSINGKWINDMLTYDSCCLLDIFKKYHQIMTQMPSEHHWSSGIPLFSSNGIHIPPAFIWPNSSFTSKRSNLVLSTLREAPLRLFPRLEMLLQYSSTKQVF